KRGLSLDSRAMCWRLLAYESSQRRRWLAPRQRVAARSEAVEASGARYYYRAPCSTERLAMSENAEKKQGHRFQPGQSGNPAGKPPGTRSKVLAELDRLGAEGAQKVLAVVLDAAQRGDMAAASIVLKRCWPEFRGRPVRLELPAITAATDVVSASAAVV